MKIEWRKSRLDPEDAVTEFSLGKSNMKIILDKDKVTIVDVGSEYSMVGDICYRGFVRIPLSVALDVAAKIREMQGS